VLTFFYFGTGLFLNLYYNFYVDFEYSPTYLLSVSLTSVIIGLSQAGSAYYAYSMCNWYFGMATRNVHAVEESIAGTTYNNAEYWGLIEKDGKDCCEKEHKSVDKKVAAIPFGKINDT
jgi:hypothetical protein